MPDCKCRDASEFAHKLIAAVSEPILLERGEVSVGASIGIVMIPRDGANPSEVLRKADLALYRAKEEGRGRFAFFTADKSSTMKKSSRSRGLAPGHPRQRGGGGCLSAANCTRLRPRDRL